MNDVARWLESIGLAQYAERFASEDIELAVLPHLTEQDLANLGVATLGHRKKLLAAIAMLDERQIAPADPGLHGRAAVLGRRSSPERRQLTVVFCDLVDSTALSAALDPEDYRELLTKYQDACARPIQRFAGHIAKYLGDGILIYFGYPHAHEDDAERAARASLEVIAAIERMAAAEGINLRCRIGIATGLVVVGDLIGESVTEEGAVSGETPNLAARLQGIAEPNSVVISESTYRLLGLDIQCEALGLQSLKGMPEPVQTWRLVSARPSDSRFEARSGEQLTVFEGREDEIDLLLRRWDKATTGNGQVVFLSGEAGNGKSRLVQVLRQRVADKPQTLMRYQCSPHHANSALYPIIRQLEDAARLAPGDTSQQKLNKLEALLLRSGGEVQETAPLFASLLSIPHVERYPPLNLTPQRQKEKSFEALVRQLADLAVQQPVLFILEDVHWADPSTCELMDMILAGVQALPVLVVITFRPEFTSSWDAHDYATTINLGRLSRERSARLAENVMGGKSLPAEVLDQIVSKTDGIPLFLEEFTKTVRDAGFLQEREDRYVLAGPLPPLAIPSTLQDSLTARLDRLSAVKQVAQVAAAIGREFDYPLLAAVSPLPEDVLQDGLRLLSEAGLIFGRGVPPDAGYTFKHALVRDSAYEGLLRGVRQSLHREIAQVLEHRFPSRAESEPELLAHHYRTAGLSEQAVPYQLAAGRVALQRSALSEAVTQLTEALETNGLSAPSQQRDQRELEIRIALATAYLASLGWSAKQVPEVLGPAGDLCRRVGASAPLTHVLFYIQIYYASRAEMEQLFAVVEEMKHLASSEPNVVNFVTAEMTSAVADCWAGKFETALNSEATLLPACDHDDCKGLVHIYNHDPRCYVLAWASLWRWALGFPDRARQASVENIRRARELGQPFNLCAILTVGSYGLLLRGEAALVLKHASEALEIAREQALSIIEHCMAPFLLGHAHVLEGRHGEAHDLLVPAAEAWTRTGAWNQIPWVYASTADALMGLQKLDEALAKSESGLEVIRQTGHRQHEAECHRIKGEVLRCMGDITGAETAFKTSLGVAQEQRARSWQLRTATSLARLWQSDGRRDEARDLLGPLYGWFTEGFDTADLKTAKSLLDELS